MKDPKNENNILGENELFRLGGKTASFIIVPTEIKYHHIRVEDLEKPVAALTFNNHTYSLFRTSNDWSEVQKITGRLSETYVITVIPKGWAIWTFEY